MSYSLWEIKEAYQSIIDDETGEILDYEAFEAIQDAEDEKIENVLALYKNKLALAASLKAEKLELGKRQAALEAQAESIKQLLERHLDGRKFEGKHGKISYRKSTTTEITDSEAFWNWEGRFMYVKNDPKPMLTEIGEAIKSGTEIPGCTRIEHTNMGIK